MKQNFGSFVVVFVIAVVVIFILAANFPFNCWGFWTTIFPGIVGIAFAVVQKSTNAPKKEEEWIYASFGLAAGSFFALQILPLFLTIP